MFNHSDQFDHFIALAAVKCTEDEAKALKELDTSNVCFDESYYRKRNKIIRKYRRMQGAKRSKHIAMRLLAAILVTVALAALLIGCVPGLRQAIYDAITGWYEQYFTVRYETPSGQEKETSPETTPENEQIVAPTFIKEIRKPTNLPDNVWEDEVVNNNAKFSIDYYMGEQHLFSYTQFLLKPSDKYVDNEDVDVTYTYINGHSATIVDYVSKKETNILWSDGEYSYHIFSTQCDLETLLEYAKSVK